MHILESFEALPHYVPVVQRDAGAVSSAASRGEPCPCAAAGFLLTACELLAGCLLESQNAVIKAEANGRARVRQAR